MDSTRVAGAFARRETEGAAAPGRNADSRVCEADGGPLEGKRVDFGQIYGYAVCLVAVLTFIVGADQFVGGILDLRELPFTESYINGPSLVSLGAYKVDLLSRTGVEDGSAAVASVLPPDSTLQRMLDAERLSRLALSFQTSRRTIVVNLVLMTIAVGLFAGHWIWLRSRERSASKGPS